jgi:hypothetical protein
MLGAAKKKVEGGEVGLTPREKPTADHIEPQLECFDPKVGAEQMFSYINGDLTGQIYQSFIAHVIECHYCLKEVVLWRAAEVLTEAEMEREKSGLSSQTKPRISSSLPRQDIPLEKKFLRGLFAHRATLFGNRSIVSPPF